MISGYLVKDINGKEKDYVGIPYPEGIISKDSPSSINFYASNFDNKEKVIEYIISVDKIYRNVRLFI